MILDTSAVIAIFFEERTATTIFRRFVTLTVAA